MCGSNSSRTRRHWWTGSSGSRAAWPPASLPRLFVDQPLSAGAELILDGGAANYLGTVLRLQAGALVKLFDDRSGEYLAQIVEAAYERHAEADRHLVRPRRSLPGSNGCRSTSVWKCSSTSAGSNT